MTMEKKPNAKAPAKSPMPNFENSPNYGFIGIVNEAGGNDYEDPFAGAREAEGGKPFEKEEAKEKTYDEPEFEKKKESVYDAPEFENEPLPPIPDT